MARTRSLTILILALFIAASIPSPSFACFVCRVSPNGWEFCRAGYNRGHGDCRDSVADSWTGRTKCEIVGWGNCYNGGTIISEGDCTNCEPFEQSEFAMSSPCSWTDTNSVRLV